ncbi:hypothetical protein BZG36_02542 [Bifiguratus adelaidae]|uniref:histidine kinase n=1 Tax=Bifiguratus adelaidae TaxID=1938954 RepID=A0A261Y248_9FUNG|nr:hypothetical protein BZG36_02542 [Bifiguratus adelaidae]
MPSGSPPKLVAVKCSINAIGWHQKQLGRLRQLVTTVHTLTSHTYQFSRFIFLHELEKKSDFPLNEWVKKEFFAEVFLSLVDSKQTSKASLATRAYRSLIGQYRSSYLNTTSFEPIHLTYAQQIALYQATTIHTAYLNNVKLRFGQQLRRIVNRLLNLKERKQSLKDELEHKNYNSENIKQTIEDTIIKPAREFKTSIANRKVDRATINQNLTTIYVKFKPILEAYSPEYKFDKDNIYYDCKANPEMHFNAFFQMALFCEKMAIKSFQCFPLRRSWIPGYMQIDTTILCQHILLLGRTRPKDKMTAWRQVVDLDSKPFKAQGTDRSLKFRGTIHTDGVGVTVLKQNCDTVKGGSGQRRNKMKVKDNEPYIHKIQRQELDATEGRCVFMDPGRRDLLYAMHENSTPEAPLTYRYTRNQKAKETRSGRFKRLREKLKKQFADVQKAENALALHTQSSIDPEAYRLYLGKRTEASSTMVAHYQDLMSTHTSQHPIFRKLRLSAYINKMQADDRLARSIRQKFGNDAVLIMDDCRKRKAESSATVTAVMPLYPSQETLSTALTTPVSSKPRQDPWTFVASSINEKAFVASAPIELYSTNYFLACGLGGILACGPTHSLVTPLDLVKCRRQVDPKIYTSNLQGWKQIIKSEGFGGVFTGVGPTFIGYSLQGMGKYGFYEVFKYQYAQMVGEDTARNYRTSLYLAASASAEFIADILLCPMEALKVRMQTEIPPYAKSVGEGFNKLKNAEGLHGFYKGIVPLWTRQIPYTMMKFASFERIVEYIYVKLGKPKEEYNKFQQLGVSFIGGYAAGILCAVVSHPADTLVSKMNNVSGGPSMSAGQLIKQLGFKGLWTGLSTRIAMIGTLTALQWLTYDTFKVYVGLPTTVIKYESMGGTVSKPKYDTICLYALPNPLVVTHPQFVAHTNTTFYVPRKDARLIIIKEAGASKICYRFRGLGSLPSFKRELLDGKDTSILTIERTGGVRNAHYRAKGAARPDRELFDATIQGYWPILSSMTLLCQEADGAEHAIRATVEGTWSLKDAIICLEYPLHSSDCGDAPPTKVTIARVWTVKNEPLTRRGGYFLDVAAGVDTALMIGICATIDDIMIARENANDAQTRAYTGAIAMLAKILSSFYHYGPCGLGGLFGGATATGGDGVTVESMIQAGMKGLKDWLTIVYRTGRSPRGFRTRLNFYIDLIVEWTAVAIQGHAILSGVVTIPSDNFSDTTSTGDSSSPQGSVTTPTTTVTTSRSRHTSTASLSSLSELQSTTHLVPTVHYPPMIVKSELLTSALQKQILSSPNESPHLYTGKPRIRRSLDSKGWRQHKKSLVLALQGGGIMGSMLRQFNWESTSLGSISNWPQSLISTISMMMASAFPMSIWWGDDFVMLYNDAYIPVAGTKHPKMFGMSGAVAWSELWSGLEPLARSVMDTATPVYAESDLFVMERYGDVEEAYYTWAYIPIRKEDGTVGGLFNPCFDETKKVLITRRLIALRELGEKMATASTMSGVCAALAQTLTNCQLDCPFAYVYTAENFEQHDESQTEQESRSDVPANLLLKLQEVVGLSTDHPQFPQEVTVDSSIPQTTETRTFKWPFQRVCEKRKPVMVDVADLGISIKGRSFDDLIKKAIVYPITTNDYKEVSGVLVMGLNVRRPYDDDYSTFCNLLVRQIGTSLVTVKMYQSEVQRAEALIAIDRAKTSFFSSISHELRTPLTLILSPLEDSLGDTTAPLPDGHKQAINLVYRNAQRLLRLVNSILDFSRVEAGRMTARLERRCHFEVDCEENGRKVWVDRDMWEKVVFNLIGNAFKFTLKGTIKVSLRPSADNSKATFTVYDTGAGIPSHELPRVFERFHRFEGQRGRSHEGTGIGLALTMELVKVMGGTLDVESEFGKGSSFIVTLPYGTAHHNPALLQANAADPIDEVVTNRTWPYGSAIVDEARLWLSSDSESSKELQPSETASSTENQSLTSGSIPMTSKGCRVLLADDNPDMQRYIRTILSRWWKVKVVSDGRAALEAAMREPPDLIVTNVMMPILDGISLLKVLRSQPETKYIPIILLSARAGEEARVDGLQASADDYLVKPFNAKELIARVHTHLELGKLRAELEQRVRQRTKALEESEYRYEILAALSPVGIFQLNPEGKIVYANDKDRVFGFLDQLVDKGQSGTIEYRWAQADGSERWCICQIIVNKDDNDAVQGFIGALTDVTERRLLEKQRLDALAIAEQQQRRRAEEAEAIKQQQELFIDRTCHELRNPLNGIYHNADILQDSLTRMHKEVGSLRTTASNSHGMDASEEAEISGSVTKVMEWLGSEMVQDLEAVETINLCALHQKKIADDVLQMSKISMNLVVLSYQNFDPAQEITNIIRMFESELKNKEIESKFVVGEGYRNVRVRSVKGDPTRLGQVVINLLANAIRFTEKSSRKLITIKLDAEPVKAKDKITLPDTGVGMTPDEQTQLFRRFRQANPKTYSEFGGNGLGLFISKHLIELQGGEIHVESDKDVGTTFHFYIISELGTDNPPTPDKVERPVMSSGITDDIDIKDIVNKIGPRQPAISLGARPTLGSREPSGNSVTSAVVGGEDTNACVLVVEDNLVNQKILTRQIKTMGHSAQVAHNGLEALDRLRASPVCPFDVILMDIKMPIMDGIQATYAIRVLEQEGKLTPLNDREKRIPIIVVTGNARKEQLEKALDAGMDDCIVKPYTKVELADKLEQFLRSMRQRAADEPPTKRSRSDEAPHTEVKGELIDINAACKEVLQEISEFKDENDRVLSKMFLKLPSRKLYPDYYAFINEPLSLENIKGKLNGNKYASFQEFKDDMDKVFNNAQEYNESSSMIYQDASVLQGLMRDKMLAYLPRKSLRRSGAEKAAAAPPEPPQAAEPKLKPIKLRLTAHNEEDGEKKSDKKAHHHKDHKDKGDKKPDKADKKAETPDKGHDKKSSSANVLPKIVLKTKNTQKIIQQLIERINDKTQDKFLSILEEHSNIDINTLVPTEMYGQPFTWSVLHAAAYGGDSKVVKILMEQGADINLRDTWHGGDALAWAAFGDKHRIVKMLIEKYGADPHAKNDDGQEAYDIVSNPLDPRWEGILTSELRQPEPSAPPPAKENDKTVIRIRPQRRPSTAEDANEAQKKPSSQGKPDASVEVTEAEQRAYSQSQGGVRGVAASGKEFSQVEFMKEMFAAISDHETGGRHESEMFQELPSKEEYPEYYQVIENPISLEQIQQKMRNGYKTLEDFEKDMWRLFENALFFNEEGSQIYKDAKRLQKIYYNHKKHLLDLHGITKKHAITNFMTTPISKTPYKPSPPIGTTTTTLAPTSVPEFVTPITTTPVSNTSILQMPYSMPNYSNFSMNGVPSPASPIDDSKMTLKFRPTTFENNQGDVQVVPVKRGRGRPRKYPLPEGSLPNHAGMRKANQITSASFVNNQIARATPKPAPPPPPPEPELNIDFDAIDFEEGLVPPNVPKLPIIPFMTLATEDGSKPSAPLLSAIVCESDDKSFIMTLDPLIPSHSLIVDRGVRFLSIKPYPQTNLPRHTTFHYWISTSSSLDFMNPIVPRNMHHYQRRRWLQQGRTLAAEERDRKAMLDAIERDPAKKKASTGDTDGDGDKDGIDVEATSPMSIEDDAMNAEEEDDWDEEAEEYKDKWMARLMPGLNVVDLIVSIAQDDGGIAKFSPDKTQRFYLFVTKPV